MMETVDVQQTVTDLITDESGMGQFDQVLREKAVARNTGFFIGASVVVAGVVAHRLYKKFKKQRDVVVAEVESEPNN